MSKSKEELNKIKEEVEAVNEKLVELTDEEIAQINGGCAPPFIGGKCGLVPVSDEPVVGGADGRARGLNCAVALDIDISKDSND